MDPLLLVFALVCIVWGIALALDASGVYPQPLVRKTRLGIGAGLALGLAFLLGRKSRPEPGEPAEPSETVPGEAAAKMRAEDARTRYTADPDLDELELELKRRALDEDDETPSDGTGNASAADRWRNL